jgi:hypothetical protein
MVRRGADAKGGANKKPVQAHVHALKTQFDAGQFLKMRGRCVSEGRRTSLRLVANSKTR